MIAPEAYKVKCPKCGFSKVMKHRSDVLELGAMLVCCPKCKTKLEKVELGALENLMSKIL